jgi:hypothetical protein
MAESTDENPMEVEKTNENQTEADDITVATATKATKTDYIAQEMEEQGLRFEIPYRKGHASDDDTKLHAQLLKLLTNAFDENELRVYNNKNKKVKDFEEKKWEDNNYYKTHFDAHVDTQQRKTVVAHRIHSKLSISNLKGEPTVIAFLKRTNTYLRAHYWKEDELELKDIGFLLSYVPTKHSKTFVQNDMIQRTEALLEIDWAEVPPFQLIHAQPKVKLTGKNKALMTHAYSVQVKTKDAPAMNKFMRLIYGDEHLYMPYNMKRQFPKAVAQAIVKQNKLIAETYVIVLVGVSRDIMNELQAKILEETTGATAISDTHRTDKTGRWYVIIQEKAFMKGRKLIAANLHKWIRAYPAALHETTPDTFPPPQVNQKYADDDDDSSGHASYMSSCAQSYGTVDDTDVMEEIYFYPPSNNNNAHSYADAARKGNTTSAKAKPSETEIKLAATETELRSIILTLQNEVRALKGAQTPSTVTEVSTPASEASKLSSRMDQFENNVHNIQTMMAQMQEMMRNNQNKRNTEEEDVAYTQIQHQSKRADTRSTPERHDDYHNGYLTQPTERRLEYADNGDGSTFSVGYAQGSPQGGWPQYTGTSHGHGQRGTNHPPPGGWVQQQNQRNQPMQQQQRGNQDNPMSSPARLPAEGARTYCA